MTRTYWRRTKHGRVQHAWRHDTEVIGGKTFSGLRTVCGAYSTPWTGRTLDTRSVPRCRQCGRIVGGA